MENNSLLNQFNETEIKMHTPLLRQFGRVTGFTICTIKSDNIDLKYKEKRNANNIANLTTNIPVKKYFVEAFPVLGIKLDKSANGNAVVVFNDDDNLRFTLSQDSCDSILHATKKSINKAIEEYEESKGEKVKFFTDIELCTEVATDLNTENAEALNKLAEILMNQASAISTLNTSMKADLDSYLATISD